MPISRIARTHLIYQFLILTLLFLGIAYYELYPERKSILCVAFISIFVYQLMILSCCTGMLRIPHWMNPGDFSRESSPERVQIDRSESEKLLNENVTQRIKMPIVQSVPDPSVANGDVTARTYKVRNWKTNSSVYETTALQSPSISSLASIEKSEFTFGKCGTEQELTKRYFFPFRQKRLEQWIESAETVRPFKIRTKETSFSNELKSDSQPSSSTSELKTGTTTEVPADCVSTFETGLTKSYSFPFRQKSLESGNSETKIKVEGSPLSNVPYWQTVGYSVAVRQEARRRHRRSVSGSRLNCEQLGVSRRNDRFREFSQSMEVSNVPRSCDLDAKTIPKAPAINFSKIKQGLTNCFHKVKKDKVNCNKQETESKMRLFKSLSKENTSESQTNGNVTFNSTIDSNDKDITCPFYPRYIPFEKSRFEKDVQQRMIELSRA